MLPSGAFPKILIVAPFPPGVPGGSAWLLDQLLRGVPADRVAWWSVSGQPTAEGARKISQYASGHLPRLLLPLRRYIQPKCFLLETTWVPRAVRSLQTFIDQQQPDLLWVLPYLWSIPVLARAIPKLGIPWHITVHDFADTAGAIAQLGARRGRRFQRMIEILYAGAASRDVYMQEIADEMARATGHQADAIIRCGVEPEEFAHIQTRPLGPPREKIRIGYPGTIVAEATFAKFIAALQLVRSRLPLPVEVNLFGPHSYRTHAWFDPTLIVEHGFLADDELERRFGACDWGLAIMELDDSNPRYSRFTFPCKFTRSLAAGLPLICLGHKETTLIRMAGQYHIGPAISAPTAEEIARQLLPALTEPRDDDALRRGIVRCARLEFDAERNRTNLHALFRAYPCR